MKWQILDWNISPETLQRINLELRERPRIVSPVRDPGILTETEPPRPKALGGQTTISFNNNTLADNSRREAQNKELGDAGEELVVAWEKKSLTASGKAHLAQRVRHVAKEEGDGAGYDVLSFTIQGQEKYIEVKTTRGPDSSSFFITSNELKTSERLDSDFYVYRVYEYDDATRSGKYFVIKGNMRRAVKLTPMAYRATL